MDPPIKLNLWVSHAQYIITTRRARKTMEPWKYQRLLISHPECGGITTGSWNLYVYFMLHNEPLMPPSAVAGRDLSSIINTKVEGMPCPAPIALPHLVREVIEVRPKTYHGGGLLPWGCFDGKIVAPCIFSRTGWVRRKLTGGEVLKALDIPDELEAMLTSLQVKSICSDTTLIPLKVATALIDAIPSAHNLGSSLLSSECKRTKLLVESTAKSEYSASQSAVESPAALSPDDEGRIAKATKADDAVVPEYLWDRQLSPTLDPILIKKLRYLRRFALRWWKLHLEKEFFQWFSLAYPDLNITDLIHKTCNPSVWPAAVYRDWEAGMDCLRRIHAAEWWEWTDGSRPFYWRWPLEYQTIIRDGLPIWELSELPKCFVPQQAARIRYMHLAMKRKLATVRNRRYIIPGTVRSLTSLFSVPKGDTDIRLVYDGTKSGLNKAVWAPWFPLPTIEAHL
jgi:hypothetical protein